MSMPSVSNRDGRGASACGGLWSCREGEERGRFVLLLSNQSGHVARGAGQVAVAGQAASRVLMPRLGIAST